MQKPTKPRGPLTEDQVLACILYAWGRTDRSELNEAYYEDNKDYLAECPEKPEGWSEGQFPN